jgi:hypothetical protein
VALAATLRDFAFYVADPIASIYTDNTIFVGGAHPARVLVIAASRSRTF